MAVTRRQRAARRYAGAVRALADATGRSYAVGRQLYRALKDAGRITDASDIYRVGPRVLTRILERVDEARESGFRRELLGAPQFRGKPASEEFVFGRSFKDQYERGVNLRLHRMISELGVDRLRVTVTGTIRTGGDVTRHVRRSVDVTREDFWPAIWRALRSSARAEGTRQDVGSEVAVTIRKIEAAVLFGDLPAAPKRRRARKRRRR